MGTKDLTHEQNMGWLYYLVQAMARRMAARAVWALLMTIARWIAACIRAATR